MACVFKAAVKLPEPAEEVEVAGLKQVYVAAPAIFSPLGKVPGRLLLKATPLTAEVVLLLESVISSWVVSLG